MKPPFNPFANETDAQSLGNLVLENRLDRLAIYGDLDLTRDQSGLQHAKQLKNLLDAVVKQLESEAAQGQLPVTIKLDSAKNVKNPFA